MQLEIGSTRNNEKYLGKLCCKRRGHLGRRVSSDAGLSYYQLEYRRLVESIYLVVNHLAIAIVLFQHSKQLNYI